MHSASPSRLPALGLLLLLVLAVAWCPAPTSAADAAPVACACPLNYMPVCGSDGVTYPNDCPLTRCGNGTVKVASQGPCPAASAGNGRQPATNNSNSSNSSATSNSSSVVVTPPRRPVACACPRIYMPVCATNGVTNRTFASECTMKCTPGAWKLLRSGTCQGNLPQPQERPSCACPRNFAPVCARQGTKQRTFANDCVRKCTPGNWTLLASGSCSSVTMKPNCACPFILLPVCASNGKISRTFSNECLAVKCSVGSWKVLHQGNCGSAAPQPPHRGPSAPSSADPSKPQGTSMPCFCDKSYVPVCATNGRTTQTFANACQVTSCTSGSYRVLYSGVCAPKDVTSGGTPVTRPVPRPPVQQRPPCACPAIYLPVCGTDGITYDNDCPLTRCGDGIVTVAHQGPCKAPQPAQLGEGWSWWFKFPFAAEQQANANAAAAVGTPPRKLLQAVAQVQQPAGVPSGPGSVQATDSDQAADTDSDLVTESGLVADDDHAAIADPLSITDDATSLIPEPDAGETHALFDFSRLTALLRARGQLLDEAVAAAARQQQVPEVEPTTAELQPVGPQQQVPAQSTATQAPEGSAPKQVVPTGPGTPSKAPARPRLGSLDPAHLAEINCTCPAVFAPVCGSDGKTYPSKCVMSQCGTSKVTVAREGPCEGGAEEATIGAGANGV